jgi:hypothetical protein
MQPSGAGGSAERAADGQCVAEGGVERPILVVWGGADGVEEAADEAPERGAERDVGDLRVREAVLPEAIDVRLDGGGGSVAAPAAHGEAA